MKIAGMQKNSTIDYPGVLSAVLFTPGCNFDCYYCHNKHLLGDAALLDNEEIWDFLDRRKGLIDGVVITGGEATLQADLPDFVSEIKQFGYKVKLDTNGSRPDVVKELIDDAAIDSLAVDYKAPLELYSEMFGIDGSVIADTFETVINSGVDYELRTTMIPEITHGRFYEMSLAYPNLNRYAVQLYIPRDDGRTDDFIKNAGIPGVYSPKDLNTLADKIRHLQPNVLVRA